MRIRPAALAAAALSLAVARPIGAAETTPSPENPLVTTFAGNGRLGIADGSAQSAQFILPTGMTRANDGALIVADAGAQRIRRISATGDVTTLAGGGTFDAQRHAVAGAFRDGAALDARFDDPTAVLARPDGSILVADTLDSCVREIARGLVTTFAGTCGHAGTNDGGPKTALLAYPRALAAGPGGSTYVGDTNGIHIVSPAGDVRALPAPVGFVYGLSIVGTTLFATDPKALIAIDLAHPQQAKRYEAASFEDDRQPHFSADDAMGHPFGIVALDTSHVLYTDLVSNCVRLMTLDHGQAFVRVVGPPVAEDADKTSGAFRDGAEPLYDGPWSVLADGDGGFFLADSANRRIRKLGPFDLATIAPEDAVARLAAAHAPEKALIVGNSLAAFDTDPDETSGAFAERSLHDDGIVAAVAAGSFPLASNAAVSDFLSNYVTPSVARDVLLVEDRFSIDPALAQGDYAKWSAPFRAQMLAMDARARAEGYRLTIVLQPLPEEVPLGESLAIVQRSGVADLPEDWMHAQFLQALAGTSLRVLDLWPAYEQRLSGDSDEALFATDDFHPSLAGRAFIGDQIARYLRDKGYARGEAPAPAR